MAVKSVLSAEFDVNAEAYFRAFLAEVKVALIAPPACNVLRQVVDAKVSLATAKVLIAIATPPVALVVLTFIKSVGMPGNLGRCSEANAGQIMDVDLINLRHWGQLIERNELLGCFC